MSCAVVFGGVGFIGSFFARFLLDQKVVSKVYLYDLEALSQKPSSFRRGLVTSCDKLQVVVGDVRRPIDWVPGEPVELIANFAAVHREPGHEDFEYYETNLLGAEKSAPGQRR